MFTKARQNLSVPSVPIQERKPEMKYLKHKDGSVLPLWHRIFFKVIIGEKSIPINFVAPPGRAYSERQIDMEVERVVDYIDQKFPKLEFKMVQILPNRFNFVAVNVKEGESHES